tara:strand:- start:64 stop:354 length:291 start_codon:yes stop_codon:yes gene_type:complete
MNDCDPALNILFRGEAAYIPPSCETLTSDLSSPVLATVLGLVTTENATLLLTIGGGGFNRLLSPNSFVLNIKELPDELIYNSLGLTGYEANDAHIC